MRTPREILLARHAVSRDELDAVRKKVVAGVVCVPEKGDAQEPGTFIGFLFSLRWHAAAMGATWVLILLLGRGNGTAHGEIAVRGGTPPPLIYFIELREYRRELAELNGPPPRRTPPAIPHAFAPPRRREMEIDGIA